MLKYYLVIPLFVFGALGYTAQSVYGESMAPTSNQSLVGRPKNIGRINALVEDADASSASFAEKIDTLMSLSSSCTLSTTDAVVLRSVITDRFHEAFTTISRLEDTGHFAEAAPARERMQVAIDNYMHATPEHMPAITRDLETYSKFMTETLIERSVAAAS